MSYKIWMQKVNELLKPHNVILLRRNFTYRAYRAKQSPEDFVKSRYGKLLNA